MVWMIYACTILCYYIYSPVLPPHKPLMKLSCHQIWRKRVLRVYKLRIQPVMHFQTSLHAWFFFSCYWQLAENDTFRKSSVQWKVSSYIMFLFSQLCILKDHKDVFPQRTALFDPCSKTWSSWVHCDGSWLPINSWKFKDIASMRVLD